MPKPETVAASIADILPWIGKTTPLRANHSGLVGAAPEPQLIGKAGYDYRMKNLIAASELYARLGAPDLVVVDTRCSLQDISYGERAYRASHLPGAVFLDIDRDLSGPKRLHGGRHPLPEVTTLVAKLSAAGIGNSSQVVAYDDAGGMFAGRLWWLLKYLGHDAVKLLDGGWPAWLEAGYPVSTEAPKPAPQRFTPCLRPELLVTMAEVRHALDDPDTVLLDARAPERYRGELEPLDPKAGHIPGARNYPFADNLEGGKFKDIAALHQRFAGLIGAKRLIAYCGSGVSSAHNIIALDEIGVSGVQLYAGSWSDWVSFEDNPIVTGAEG